MACKFSDGNLIVNCALYKTSFSGIFFLKYLLKIDSYVVIKSARSSNRYCRNCGDTTDLYETCCCCMRPRNTTFNSLETLTGIENLSALEITLNRRSLIGSKASKQQWRLLHPDWSTRLTIFVCDKSLMCFRILWPVFPIISYVLNESRYKNSCCLKKSKMVKQFRFSVFCLRNISLLKQMWYHLS